MPRNVCGAFALVVSKEPGGYGRILDYGAVYALAHIPDQNQPLILPQGVKIMPECNKLPQLTRNGLLKRPARFGASRLNNPAI
jgi:hypothetical protein